MFSQRAATYDDAAMLARVMTAWHPEDPYPVDLARLGWEDTVARGAHFDAFVLLREGQEVGYAWETHAPWRPDVERCGEVNVRVPPEVEDEALLRHSVELVETHACAEHAES
jgi:hypothetical protein